MTMQVPVMTEAARNTIVPGLTANQVQRLLSLIENPKEGYEKLSGNVSWLFDTGAWCHTTGVYDVLENVRSIHPVVVGLPDGNKVLARKVRTVKLGPKLILNDVFFVTKLTCNLISIYQLNKESNSTVTFTDSFCVVTGSYLEEPDWSR